MNESINELYEIINKQNIQLNEQNDKINKQNIQLNKQNDIINKLRNEINKTPIGIIEKENKIFGIYSKKQFRENNYRW